MKCRVCGSHMHDTRTDLPFKITDTAIVIIKDIPVLQCGNCAEYLIQNTAMERVDAILGNVNATATLEIFNYAA